MQNHGITSPAWPYLGYSSSNQCILLSIQGQRECSMHSTCDDYAHNGQALGATQGAKRLQIYELMVQGVISMKMGLSRFFKLLNHSPGTWGQEYYFLCQKGKCRSKLLRVAWDSMLVLVETEYRSMLFRLETERSNKELYQIIAQSRPVQMISY